MSSPLRLAQYGGYIFIVRTAMTPTQVSIVRDSYYKIAPQISDASEFFYEELFRIAPDMRDKFPADLQRHRQKFAEMFSLIVRNLERIEVVSDDIVDLGYRHLAYEVEEDSYAAFGEALMAVLRRLLGADFTPEASASWFAAYDMLARIMQEAVTIARSGEGFYSRVIRHVMVAHYGVAMNNEGRGGKAPISREIDSGKVIRLS